MNELEIIKVLLSIFAHDLKDVFQAVQGYVELLKDQTPEESQKYLLKMSEQISKSEKMMNLYTSVDFGKNIPLDKLLEKVCDATGIVIETRLNSEMRLNPIFGIVLYNLAKNSVLHSGKTEKDLVITVSDQPNKIIFEDNGRGIKEEQKKRIFEKEKHALSIIKALGMLLHFDIEETGSKGARFEITVF